MADITDQRHLNPDRRDRTYPRVVRRARHNTYRVKRAPTSASATTAHPPSARQSPTADQLKLSGIARTVKASKVVMAVTLSVADRLRSTSISPHIDVQA